MIGDDMTFAPHDKILLRDEVHGLIVSTVRLPESYQQSGNGTYETLIKGPDGLWGWGGISLHTDTESEARAAHREAIALVKAKIQ